MLTALFMVNRKFTLNRPGEILLALSAVRSLHPDVERPESAELISDDHVPGLKPHAEFALSVDASEGKIVNGRWKTQIKHEQFNNNIFKRPII